MPVYSTVNRHLFLLQSIYISIYCYITTLKGENILTFSITSAAANLYKDITLEATEALRLFVKYAGSGDSGGFSLGVTPAVPDEDDYVQEVDGLRFFVRNEEKWLVENMKLDYDESTDYFSCHLPGLA